MNTPGGHRLTMDRLLWTAAVVVGSSIPHWPNQPFWIPVLLAASVFWRLAAAAFGWRLPGRSIRLLFALIAFVAVLVRYKTINGVSAGSALLVVMVALKYLESRTHRDQLILMIIAYFLVFAGFLYKQGFGSAIYLLLFVWITTVGLLQLGRRGPLLANRPTAKLAGRLLLQAVPFMLVLFVLFPRLQGPLWGIPGNTSSGATGLSDSMSPGDITDLGLSDEIAFRAQFFSAPPAAGDLYWRGPVLSSFNGRSWTRDPGMRRRVFDTLEYSGDPIEYRVMQEPNGRRWAFALDMPANWVSEPNIVMGSDYQLRMFVSESPDTRIDFQVTSYTQYRANEALREVDRERLTRIPPDSNPRTRTLVESWLAESDDKRQVIAKALDVFRADEFFYTLTPPALGQHTADEFIFETREGFCEHYASAFTIMLRFAGIPARVVTGYQGGELNGIGGYYMIRQSDAHAWTEVWLENEGWVRVDPTAAVAPERIAFGSTRSALANDANAQLRLAQANWLRTALLAWDTANTYWNDWIVGYGPRLQRSLLESLGFERPRWRQLLVLTIVATALLLIGLSLYFAWIQRQPNRPDLAARAFARFVAKLAKLKVATRASTETPTQYAARAKECLPMHADQIDSIVGTYLSAHFEPDDGDKNLTRLQRLIQEFRPAETARA